MYNYSWIMNRKKNNKAKIKIIYNDPFHQTTNKFSDGKKQQHVSQVNT